MAEVKIICKDADSLRMLVEKALAERLRGLEDGIRRTEERLREFEDKYQMSTEEFMRRFENDEITHRLDMEFDEWIGESWMLKRLQEEVETLRGVEFVN
jgi:predicted DNA-binding protein YlxM (UPF0122 family)